MSEPMAVEAPTAPLESTDQTAVPQLPSDQQRTNGDSVNANNKRAASTSPGAEAAAKKPRKTSPVKPVLAGKKKNVIESSDEEDEPDSLANGNTSAIASRGKPINPDEHGKVHAHSAKGGDHVHPSGVVPPAIDQSNVSDKDEDDTRAAKSKPPSSKKTAKTASSSSKPDSKRQKPSSKRDAKKDSSSSEDEKPLAKTTKPSSSRRKDKGPSYKEASDPDASSEDEKPLAKKVKTTKESKAPNSRNKGKKTAQQDEDSEDEKPLKKTVAESSKKQRKSKTVEEDESEDEKPLKKAVATKGKKTVKAETPNGDEKPSAKQKGKGKASAKKEDKEEDEEDNDEAFKWWEADNNDGSVKWTTLEHNGVLFPPAYEPLPDTVKMTYDGKPITLSGEAEEVAGFFAALIDTDHAADATFRANFFRDWTALLKTLPPKEKVKIDDIEKCNFRPIKEHFDRVKASVTAADKKKIKADKEELEKDYKMATIDGRKEKIGNFRVEPPGLFRGRGEHPKKGTFKHRLRPEDIVINIGKDAPVPVPNIPGNWKEIQHDNTVTWLAHWKENVNDNFKYVFLSAGSTWKGQSDRQKFEKAKKLQDYVDVIRKDYTAELKSKVMADRQRATAMYLIDVLALRAGNEKGEEEADTVGCCSLRLEHVTLIPPSTIELRFLGKDSIMYEQEVEVDPQVFKNIKLFKASPKEPEDDLFDRLTTSGLNKHLATYMDGLTAKVFRTYNASHTFQQQLNKLTPKDGTVAEKIAAYNKANKEVAILCNHQKTVSKTHGDSMAKLGDNMLGIKYQRMRLRYTLFTMEPAYKSKKKHPEIFDLESDLDDEFFERHEKHLLEQNIIKAEKKFARENAKLAEEDGKPQNDSVLKERITKVKEENKEMIKERKSKTIETSGRGKADADKILAKIAKLDERIETAKVKIEDRESNKTVALGTSKMNYIDPRLTAAWAKKHEVPLERVFTKVLIEKFAWAIAEVESNPKWSF